MQILFNKVPTEISFQVLMGYTRSCYKIIYNNFLFVFQILGIIFAVLLGKSVRKLKTQMLVERTEAQQKFYQQIVAPKLQEKGVVFQPTQTET